MGRYKWLLRFAGVLLFLLVLSRMDLVEIGQTLLKANPFLVILSSVGVIPFLYIKAWRWKTILDNFKVRIPLSTATQLYAIGLAAGSFTPGQAGDAVKAWYLKRVGHSLWSSLISTVVDRFFDLFILLLLSLSSVAVFWRLFQGQLGFLVALFVLIFVALMLFINRDLREKLIDKGVNYFVPKKIKDLAGKYNARTYLSDIAMTKRSFLSSLGITFFSFTFSFFRIYLLMWALGLFVGPIQLMAIASLSTVVSIIPVSVGGIGTRDVTLILIFAELGFTSEQALSLSLLILILNVVNLLAGFFVWFRYPDRIEMKEVTEEA